MIMDYSPWSEREIWPFLRVAVSPKPEGPRPPKLVYMTNTLQTVKMYVAEPKNTVTQQKAKLKCKKIIKTDHANLPYSVLMSTVLRVQMNKVKAQEL